MRKKRIGTAVAVIAMLLVLAGNASAWLDSEDIYRDGICFSLNEDEMTAEITGIYDAESEYMAIPEYVSEYVYDDYYDGSLEKFYVTAITGFFNEYAPDDQTVKTVRIPDTVTRIDEKTVGWYVDAYYDYDFEDFVEVYRKIDGFTIICSENSEAERYARENGFNCRVLRNISYSDISLSAESFVYSGQAVQPGVSIYYRGVRLTEGEDYTLTYENNINAGTAAVVAVGQGEYTGTQRTEFVILPADASEATVSKIGTQYYTGKKIKPTVTVTLGSKTLEKGRDYSLKYSSNKYIGTASVTAVFEGNYSGIKSVNFNIKMSPMKNAEYASTAYKIKLTWDKIACDEYRVYRYNRKTKEYDLIKKTASSSYTDKGLATAAAYKYKIRAVVKDSGKEYLNKCVTVKAATRTKTPSPTVGRDRKTVKITWKRDKLADGYQIGQYDYTYTHWWYEGTGNIKKIKTIKGNSTVKWTKNIGTKNEYVYTVRSYKKLNGQTVYSEWSKPLATGSVEARVNMAELKSHRDIPVYNAQGEKTALAWTYNLSDKDIKLLKAFAKKHFTAKMSRIDKIRITLNWINQEVDYAYDYGKISGCSYVEAIFKHKLGQCLQYNGALAGMLAYLGYDVRIIQGYRGSWPSSYWQHFWCEVKIAGVTYLCETGNYGKNGSWSYLMTEYPETSGYIKNHKNI